MDSETIPALVTSLWLVSDPKRKLWSQQPNGRANVKAIPTLGQGGVVLQPSFYSESLIVPNNVEQEIRELAVKFALNLKTKVDARVKEMNEDDKSHFLIYRVLGVPIHEGNLIDVYQNKGRFLYNSAGNFLEKATKICFKHAFPDSASLRVPNTQGQRPKTFEIDCLVGLDALEIKWRDATTDGDHITKEHTRILAVKDAGYKPIRVMFYYPNRAQAMKIQKTLETLYTGVSGEYYYGDTAWSYVQQRTGINFYGILEKLANENTAKV